MAAGDVQTVTDRHEQDEQADASVDLVVHGRLEGRGRYRAAIIGLGRMGNRFGPPGQGQTIPHSDAYVSVPSIELCAGADPDIERLRRFTDRYGLANGFRDYREMLRSQPFHLLSICAPTALHHEMVMEGVMAGVKAILCEKPLARTVEEAAEMVEACKAAGVVLAVNYPHRWEPACREVKRLLDEGAIGRLESIVGYYSGRVMSVGTHLLDLMRWYAGDIAWVWGDALSHGESEPSAGGHLRFRSDARGAVIAGWDSTNHLFELDLHGSRGRIRLLNDGTEVEQFHFEPSRTHPGCHELAGRPVTSQPAGPPPLIAAIHDVLRSIQTGDTPACSGEDGLAALEAAWALCDSSARGHVRIDLPLAGAGRTVHT